MTKLRRSWRGISGAASVAAAIFLGCNALLGNESAVFAPEDAASAADAPPVDAREGGVPLRDGGAAGDADACVDTQLDPRHCGRCFHDCQGGACVGGACQPVELAAAGGRPGALAVDATHVYWTVRGQGDLLRVPIDGGAVEQVFDGSPGQDLGNGFAVHAGHVYFGLGIGDGGIVRCPTAGCRGSAPETIVPKLRTPDFVTIDDAGVLLFVEVANPGRIGRCTLPCAGGFEVVATDSLPLRAATVSGTVAWTRATPEGVRIKRAGAIVDVPTEDPVYPVAIAGSEVIFSVFGKGLEAVLLDGGSRRRLVPRRVQTDFFAIAGGDVFFAEQKQSGRVLACPIAGCDAAAPLAAGQNWPRPIAVDAVNVYWGTEAFAPGPLPAILRVAR